MRFSLYIFILLISSAAIAQNEPDEPDDSLHAILLNQQAHEELSKNNLDKALVLAESSRQEIYQENNPALDADNLLLIATIYSRKQLKDNAIKYFIRAISAYEKINDERMLVSVYHQAGDYFFGLNAWSKALENYRQAKSLAKENDAYELLKKIGICHYQLLDYARSIDVFNQLLGSLPPEAYTQRLDVLSHLTNSSNKLKDYERSLFYDKEILSIYSTLNDKQGILIAINNLAFDYVHLKGYTAAISSFKEALSIARQLKTNNKEQADLLINIGICYQNSNDFDNALTNLIKAYQIVQDKPELFSMKAELENIIAISYFYKSDYYNAEVYSKRSIYSARQDNNREMLQSCFYTYSQILKAGNDFIKALEYYEMHLSLKDSVEREEKGSEQRQLQENLNLEKTEKELRLKLADEEIQEMQLRRMKLEAEKREKELDLLRKERELESSEKERIMQSLKLTQQQHEAELRNKELKSLEQEKEIKDLELKQKVAEKKEQEKEISLLQLEKEKQSEARKRAIYSSILIGMIGLLILVGLLMTRRKNAILANQKQEIEEKNRVLEQKNEEILTQTEQLVIQKEIIEEKNIAIIDSILYASRIQGAVLPLIEELQQFFADSFILFKPLNIVSGDFYWGIRKGKQVIIAAADCTGHGVPGAFMSMLGCTFLNVITSLPDLPDAAFVLNELRKNVMKALRQKGETGEAQDGMDIALCIIDMNSAILHYAGANNPLYRIHNNEITVIKGDRMPIGIHLNSHIPFKDHAFEIEKDDSFYIFSDGLADQFGGPDNKKFKYQQLQELLLTVHRNPFSMQQQLIENAFNDWKGVNDQIDDILLIGFKPIC